MQNAESGKSLPLAKPSLPKGGGTALAVGGFRRETTEGGGRIVVTGAFPHRPEGHS